MQCHQGNETYGSVGKICRSVNGRAEFVCPLQANRIGRTYIEIEITEIRCNTLNSTYNPFVNNGLFLSDSIQKGCQISPFFIQKIGIVHNMAFFGEGRAFARVVEMIFFYFRQILTDNSSLKISLA